MLRCIASHYTLHGTNSKHGWRITLQWILPQNHGSFRLDKRLSSPGRSGRTTVDPLLVIAPRWINRWVIKLERFRRVSERWVGDVGVESQRQELQAGDVVRNMAHEKSKAWCWEMRSHDACWLWLHYLDTLRLLRLKLGVSMTWPVEACGSTKDGLWPSHTVGREQCSVLKCTHSIFMHHQDGEDLRNVGSTFAARGPPAFNSCCGTSSFWWSFSMIAPQPRISDEAWCSFAY